MEIFPGAKLTASALNAERLRMEIVSENLANLNTTRGVDGKAYQRQQVVFESVLQRTTNEQQPLNAVAARVEKDDSPPRMVHDPGHPDANSEGMVALPDIDLHREMVDLITASRAFEANLAVLKNARSMALQTLSIGKRS